MQRLWRGLSSVLVSLLVLSLTAAPIVERFRTDIDKFLGTSSTKMVRAENASAEGLYAYNSDYASTTEMVQAIADLGERMSEEGSVLLKNNDALPLTNEETQHLSLLGFSSYYPTMGGDMGSQLTPNVGTDADTVDFVQALAARGFAINPVVQALYTNEAVYVNWTGKAEKLSKIQAPYQSGTFSSKEPSQSALDGVDSTWRQSLQDYNVMLVTLARSGAENRSYYPGSDGVDPGQNLNQADPLGLSDDERDLLQAAVDAKTANGGKVIVLLNNVSFMEIEEIKQNDGVDAIL